MAKGGDFTIPKIKGLAFNGNKAEFILKNGGTIKNSLTVNGNLTIDGKLITPDEPSLKIVTFQSGTDEEIAAMLEAHYNGNIEISDYWHVGDTRMIHINAITSSSSYHSEHIAQDIAIIIYGFNHDDLVTSINGHTKAAVTVGFKEIMGNKGTAETGCYNSSSASDNSNYSSSLIRTYLNSNLFNALSSSFSSLIKEVKKKNLAYHTSTDGAPLITRDKIWLFSFPELYGLGLYPNYLNGDPFSYSVSYEGEQYELMSFISVYKEINGKSLTWSYWLRSPSSNNNYYICVSDSGLAETRSATGRSGIAPGFCL